ncbi:MAG: 16S rRNA (cytidine(1402)-2'-O)-methyltransferase, partial [Firmicutes bacterium]|nr:16S rRNA (cytidine(1402)-2'-O)-methyltransferase [Bacillota bacterium]
YEAPHRLRKTLSVLLEKLGDRKLAIGRELTKVHEEMELTTLAAAAAEYEEKEPRGEYVLILGGADPEAVRKEQDGRWEQMTMQEHMDLYADLPPKEAMKKVAADRGIARKDVYEALLKEKESRQ